MDSSQRKRDARAKAVGKQREKQRKSTFSRAKDRHEAASRRSGSHCIGRDENGGAKETRSLRSLQLVVDKWYVNMSFKREDRKRLGNRPLREVEEKLKKGNVKRKKVRFNTHLIIAVRALKHLRRGYEAEMKHSSLILSHLDSINIHVADMKGKMPDSLIDETVSWLEAFGESELAKKQVAVKRIVANARLEKTIEMLEQAKGLPEEKRAFQLSKACAVFTSLRNRLGKWRDKEIAGITEYNHQKECALRVERDNWLLARLTKFAEVPETVHQYQLIDEQKAEVVANVRVMLDDKKLPREEILGYIWENSQLFRVVEREREGAEKQIALMETGFQPKTTGKTDFLIGHYGWLYRYIKRGEEQMEKAKEYEKMARIEQHNAKAKKGKPGAEEHKAKAKKHKEMAKGHRGQAKIEESKSYTKADYLLLFADSNKPGFILNELQNEPDSYLEPVLEPFEKAVAAFEAEDFKTAKTHFAQAKERMQGIVHPNG